MYICSMAFKNASKKEKILSDKIVNTWTGETFQSEHPHVTSVNKIDPNFCIVDSEGYVIIDDNAVKHLRLILSSTDMAKLYQLTEMCRGIYNALHKDEVTAHTRETLMEELGIARTAFSSFMGRLEKAGVIAYLTVYRERRKYKHILMNPTFARRGKRFHSECRRLFEDLSK